MKRLAVLLVLAAASAAWPSAAAAKELVQAKVCGVDGCTTVTDRETLRMLPAGSPTAGSPPPAGPFYTVELTHAAEGKRFADLTWYVPSSGMVAFRDDTGATSWFSSSGAAGRALMRKLARGIEPFPRPTIARVTVDGQAVADPVSYLQLLTISSDQDALPDLVDWQEVEFFSTKPSPWTNGAVYVTYSPSANLLWRGAELIPLRDDLAARIETRESLNVPDSGFPWRYVLLGLAVLGAAAAAATFGIVLARRTRDVAPRAKTTEA